MIPKFLRNGLIRLTKEDILSFMDENHEDLIRYFRDDQTFLLKRKVWSKETLMNLFDEMEKLDERMPEEQLFIDIRMAALGEELFRAIFSAIRQFVKNY